MMVNDFGCWWQNQYVGDLFRYVGDFHNVLNRSHNLESVSNISNLSPTMQDRHLGSQRDTIRLQRSFGP